MGRVANFSSLKAQRPGEFKIFETLFERSCAAPRFVLKVCKYTKKVFFCFSQYQAKLMKAKISHFLLEFCLILSLRFLGSSVAKNFHKALNISNDQMEMNML
jgi:hypothetical protein